MTIKVEGVPPSHPQPPQEGVQVTPDTTRLWVCHYRVKALQLALLGSYANFQPNDVVARAKVFEEYILSGDFVLPDAMPSMQEQITTAFLNLTGNLDAVSGL